MLFDSLGLPPGRVLFESASRTTFENAILSRDLVAPSPGQTWLLVTSASHMPRSVGVFRRAGWPVMPWPVGYKTMRAGAAPFALTLGVRIENLDWAFHEWIGLVAYRLMDRTDSWFPAPAADVHT
jgi:uncharacterized SAM-binding protein YcdF (DUF218 family)